MSSRYSELSIAMMPRPLPSLQCVPVSKKRRQRVNVLLRALLRLTTIIALLIHSNAQAMEMATKGEILCHDALTDTRTALTDVKAQLEATTNHCNLILRQRDSARELALERDVDVMGYIQAGVIGAALFAIVRGIVSR